MPNTSYVYLIESTSGHYKIGKSRNPERRLRQLQKTKGPFEYRLISKIPFASDREACKFERLCHAEHEHQRVNGEWFQLSAKDLVDWGAICELHSQAHYGYMDRGQFNA